MIPVIVRHLDYHGSLTRRMQRYWIGWRSRPASVRKIFLRFRYLNLSNKLCKKESIVPFIDLKPGRSKNISYYQGISVDPDGVPICPEGLRMKTDDNDFRRRHAKFRCPLNNEGICSCEHPCSDSRYGRTISIPMESNIRLYTSPPSGSDEWNFRAVVSLVCHAFLCHFGCLSCSLASIPPE